MTTVVAFTPSIAPGSPPFQFQATLDGNPYNIAIKWNAASQSWYLQVTDLSGNLVVTQPLIGSSNPKLISALTWSQMSSGLVKVTTALPHYIPLGWVTLLTISGVLPSGYNATAPCRITGPSSFVYTLASNPGIATQLGSFSFDIDLLRGYFASTFVYRIMNGNIEISP